MVTLQQALKNIDSNNDDEMKKITAIITDLLTNEKTNVEKKLAQEREQVEKLKERLSSLQDNPKDDGTVNLNPSDTEQLWNNFYLQRTGVLEEICGNRSEKKTVVSLTEEENTGLRNIANAALSLCIEECKNQKENLLAALTGKPVKVLSSNELDDLRKEIKTFQLEMESDIVPFLLENFCKKLSSEELKTKVLPVVITKAKSNWILNIGQSKDKQLKGSNCEKYLKACIKICWKLANHRIPPKFVWEVRGNEESFKCLTTACKKKKSCIRRVFMPAVFREDDIISKGKYTCMLCTPGNICNSSEQNESTQSEKEQNRKSASMNTTAGSDAEKKRKSTSSTAAPATGPDRKSLNF